MTDMTAADYEALRSGIESTFNVERQTLKETYEQDKVDLEDGYQADLEANRRAKEEAFVEAGLNPDGSDPQGRPQGEVLYTP